MSGGPSADPARRTAEQAIDSYLAEIAARLEGPAGARRDIIAELGGGLADAADAHGHRGLDPAQAADAAVAEFGSAAAVAAGFRSELAAATARRSTVDLMTIGSLAGALFVIAGLASHIHQSASPGEWVPPTGAVLATLVAIPAAAVALGCHLITLAASGRLTRWLPRRFAASAAIAAGCTATTAAAMLAALTIVAASDGGQAALSITAAGAASLAGLGLSIRAVRTCLAIRAAHPRVDG